MKYEGTSIAAAGLIRPGETLTFMLPPGSYEAKTALQLFGIPFQISAGTIAAEVPIKLMVTLKVIEVVWYVLLFLGVVCAVLIVWRIVTAVARVVRHAPTKR